MLGMQERVQGLGGRYRIESAAAAAPACASRSRCGKHVQPDGARRHDQRSHHRRSSDRVCRAAGACWRTPASRPCSMRATSCPATASIAAISPDVVIVDLAMQGNGLGGCPDPAHPLARSAHAHPRVQHAQRSDHRRARARSRRHRLCAQGHLVGRAGQGVREGARWRALSERRPGDAGGAGAHRRAAQSARRPDAARAETLSLLAEGKPYGQIAEELNVSYKTVVNICSQLKQKLDAKNLPDLIRVAVQAAGERALLGGPVFGRCCRARVSGSRPLRPVARGAHCQMFPVRIGTS